MKSLLINLFRLLKVTNTFTCAWQTDDGEGGFISESLLVLEQAVLTWMMAGA